MRNINDLRDRLFAALDGLADKEKPMEVDRARAIADVAGVIIDSAKAEIQLLHTIGARGTVTGFIPAPAAAPTTGQPRLPAPGGCPHCGGRLRVETNGAGSVVDVCADCGRSPKPLLQRAK